MKKTLFFLGCLSLLAAGCNKVQNVDVPTDDPVEEIPALKFNITANFDEETRAVKRAWAEGDIIYVAFDIAFVYQVKDEATGMYYSANHAVISMTYSEDEGWVPSLPDTEFENALRAMGTGKLAAVYISGGQTPQFLFDENDFFHYFHVTNYGVLGGVILSANEVGYTISDNTLTAELNMTLDAPEGTYRYPVHFFLPSITEENASNYTFSCKKFSPDRFGGFQFGVPPYAVSGPSVSRFNIVDDSYGLPILGSYYAGGLEFVGMLKPDCKGEETEYILVITDNQGTPDDDTDDVIYTTKKSATLEGKEAFNLPALNSSRWTLSNPLTTDLDPSFNGFKNENEW